MLVEAGEGELIEFKSTLRVNLHTGEKDLRLELAIIKTIAGFLNTTGGTLVVGVSDDGVPVGLAPDGFPNEDRINLYLVDLLKSRIGAPTMLYVHPRFEDYQDERVLVVECQPSKSPVFVKDGNLERFYIRTGAATTELTASEIQQFAKQRFAA
jgi:predicted HTH transcriptional regulator